MNKELFVVHMVAIVCEKDVYYVVNCVNIFLSMWGVGEGEV